MLHLVKYLDKYNIRISIYTYYPSNQECNMCENIDKKYKDTNERGIIYEE